MPFLKPSEASDGKGPERKLSESKGKATERKKSSEGKSGDRKTSNSSGGNPGVSDNGGSGSRKGSEEKPSNANANPMVFIDTDPSEIPERYAPENQDPEVRKIFR